MGRQKKPIEPIVLAHHPSCKNFSHHTFTFRGRRLCLGCFVMYPTAAIALAALFIIDRLYQLDYFALLLTSVILFGINTIRKIALKDRVPQWGHVFFRIALGIALALALMSIYRAPGDMFLPVAAFVIIVAVIYNIFNGFHNINICKKCSQYPMFPHCDGAGKSIVQPNIGSEHQL